MGTAGCTALASRPLLQYWVSTTARCAGPCDGLVSSCSASWRHCALPCISSSTFQKGYMPEQDNGRIWGGIQADQSISFQLMKRKLAQFVEIVRQDPAVAKVVGFYGGSSSYGYAFAALKPLSDRQASAEEVINRLRPKLEQIPGASLYLSADQDVRVAGQTGNSRYQYTLLGEDIGELYEWAPKVAVALKSLPLLTDVNFDQQQGGLEANLIVDRATAARLGLTVGQIDNTLYDAFGQRQVSVIYK